MAEALHVLIEHQALHAGSAGALDVGRIVVQEEAFRRVQLILGEELFIDLLLGLEELPVRGDDMAAEMFRAGDAAEIAVEGGGARLLQHLSLTSFVEHST